MTKELVHGAFSIRHPETCFKPALSKMEDYLKFYKMVGRDLKMKVIVYIKGPFSIDKSNWSSICHPKMFTKKILSHKTCNVKTS